MGGGDLNLKKSWHPNTMRNMEKVWKAEQRDNEERRRIAELQREIVAERSREDMQQFAESSGVVEKKDKTKLDWMYKGPSGIVDREEYLLGRSIDKTFEQLEQSEQQSGKALSSRKNAVERGDECLPNSIRFAADHQVDLARKMMEDPLLAIKKKEVESRQQLLSNPVKLKQLKQLIEMQNKKKKHKKEKKVKKDKKKKKKKRKSSKDSDSDSDDDNRLDAILAKKLNSLKNAGLLKDFTDSDVLELKSKKHRKSRNHKDSDSDSDHRDAKSSSKKLKDKNHKGSDSDLDNRVVKNSSIKHKDRNHRGSDSDSDQRDTKGFSRKLKDKNHKGSDFDLDHRVAKNSSRKHKGSDSDSDRRDARNSFNKYNQSKPKDYDSNEKRRGNIKRERSVSPDTFNDRRKVTKGDLDEGRKSFNRSRDVSEAVRDYKFDNRASQNYKRFVPDEERHQGKRDKDKRDFSPGRPSKSRRSRSGSVDNRKNLESSNRKKIDFDESRQRQVKREKDKKDHSPDKPSKSRRSRSRDADDRRKHHRNEGNRKDRAPSPDDKARQRRKREDSGSSLDLARRERKGSVEKGEKKRKRQDSGSSMDLDRRDKEGKVPEKMKKLTKKRKSSSSEDSDSSSDSSSESDSSPKRVIPVKRERGSDNEDRKIPKFGLMLPDGSKPTPKPAVKVKEEKRREEPEKPKWVKPERRKLDEKEIEARRREMMQNVNWREKERERNKRRHELELEEERRQQSDKFDEDFARKQFIHAVSQTTVEGRIKSNINKIQRSKMSMDSNFARR